MRIITAPSVYLLGRQTVDDGELTRFLTDHGVSWETDSEVAGEVLAETAGRVCYMSFAKPRPGGNAAYLTHIKEVGHGCYDGETDVLTSAGWKSWPEVTSSDLLATMNPQTRAIEYHLPIRLVRYQHSGLMYRVESQQVDLLVTPDHKMLACPTTTVKGRKKENYSLIPATELSTKSHAYIKCGRWSGGWWPTCPGRDVLALLGFAIGDGSFSGRYSSSIKFHLRRDRKITWLTALVERLKPKGFRLYINEANDNYVVLLPDDKHIFDLFADIYNATREKIIPQSVLTGASIAGLEGLFEGLMQSDGHEGTTNDGFDTTSQVLVGQFQQLCLHLGFASNVCYTYGPERRLSSYGDKPLTRLTVIRRTLRPEVNKWAGCDGKSFWVNEWEGEVFCAEVPNNTLYVRRNGIPVWSGNSVLEHAVWNLLITGVSRSLTHELVRHRAGWAYSQLSQRYVDESVAEYVCPHELLEGKRMYDTGQHWKDKNNWHPIAQAYMRWEEYVEQSHRGYVDLCDLLDDALPSVQGEDKTARRKRIRQVARSVLPNATETKIFITLNARAARHFFEQRGSKHAEPEIRKLANVILDLLQRESPHLFGDYVRQSLPDGTFEIQAPYRKV